MFEKVQSVISSIKPKFLQSPKADSSCKIALDKLLRQPKADEVVLSTASFSKKYLEPLAKRVDLADDELTLFNKAVYSTGNCMDYVPFLRAQKPAVALTFDEDITAVVNKLQDDVTDIVCVRSPADIGKAQTIKQIFLINKEMTKDIINDNRMLFLKRLKMSDSSTVDEIYSKMFSKDGPIALDGCFRTTKFSDLTGIILGYPKTSAMIFALEQRSASLPYRNTNLAEYKQRLIKTLYGLNSPYKKMGKEFLDNLANKINSITRPRSSVDMGIDGYQFVYFVDEPEEIARILSYKK